MRRRLGFTQSQLAASVGAAGKAVVYQWEARKRKPSPVFWQKIQALAVDP
jgi:DNA-binding transcriptional regulator YiaG